MKKIFLGVVLFLTACSKKSSLVVSKNIKVTTLVTTNYVDHDIYTQYYKISCNLSEALDRDCNVGVTWYLVSANNSITDSLSGSVTIQSGSTSNSVQTNLVSKGNYRGNARVSSITCSSDKYKFIY